MPRRNRPRRLSTSTVPLEVRKCLFCGADFMPNRAWQKYCSPQHSFGSYYLRKLGVPNVPAADAQPHTVSKLDEFQLDKQVEEPDERKETIQRAISIEEQMPTGGRTAAARTLEGFGYGIPELDEDKKDDK